MPDEPLGARICSIICEAVEVEARMSRRPPAPRLSLSIGRNSSATEGVRSARKKKSSPPRRIRWPLVTSDIAAREEASEAGVITARA